jgi:hypothetical protein
MKRQASPTSPAHPQILSREAVSDAFKAVVASPSLNDFPTSVSRLIEAHLNGTWCLILLRKEECLQPRYRIAQTCPSGREQQIECASVIAAGSCGATT